MDIKNAGRGKAGDRVETQIQLIPVDKLVVSSKNPRKVFKDEFEDLKRSIEADTDFLYRRPILCTKVNGQYVIYAGTQRYTACKVLGFTEVPCLVTEEKGKTVDFRMVADNSHFGQWDSDKLFSEFTEEQQDMVLDTENTGDLKLEPSSEKHSTKREVVHMVRLNFATKEDRNVFYNLLGHLQQTLGADLGVAERVIRFMTQI